MPRPIGPAQLSSGGLIANRIDAVVVINIANRGNWATALQVLGFKEFGWRPNFEDAPWRASYPIRNGRTMTSGRRG